MTKNLSLALLALSSLLAGSALADERLGAIHEALTFYASFDHNVEADFAKGEAQVFTLTKSKPLEFKAGNHTDGATALAPGKGRGGSGALQFTKKTAPWLFYQAAKNLSYQSAQWSGSVSLWLKLDPEEDLEPGYCDPLFITPRAWNDAAFFVDFDKEGDPRDFRLGAFADLKLWNPEGLEVPESERPLVKVANPPFSREAWTHVAFTWERFNSGQKDGVATFYLNGQMQGQVLGWNQQFTWADTETSRIHLGVNYIGLFDDLSCFDRALTSREIKLIYQNAKAVGITLKAPLAPGLNAVIDSSELGWREMTEADFVNVNCNTDTWAWQGGEIHCTGKPVGVIRSNRPITNLELSLEWKHLEKGGNSGVFLWASPESIERLEKGQGRLPVGIEVQVLDLGYTEKYEKQHKKPSDWFTCHGDVFPTGSAKMIPFPPIAPNGKRSFPSKDLSRGVGEWNHYYIRAINGEVRLWVNGEEVSGGTKCDPATGYLCLESEGAPVVFRNLRIRELP